MAIGSHLKLNAQQVNYLNSQFELVTYHSQAYIGMPVSHISDEVIEQVAQRVFLVNPQDPVAKEIVDLANQHQKLVNNYKDNLEATRNGPNCYGSLSS